MLSEADKLLITAAVDGELTADQERAFQFLIATSKPAVALHDALVEDRDRLAGLPKVSAPAALYPSIFARLQALPAVEPKRLPRPAPRSWLPAATAASFLLAVASGAYWFASPDDSRTPKASAAKQAQQLPKEGVKIAPMPGKSIRLPDANQVAVEQPTVPPMPDPLVPPTAVVKNDQPESKPESVPTIMAAPVGSEVKAFDRVDVKLPLLTPFADFAREDTQASLRAHLTREPATRIDLFAKDAARAADALVAAGKGVNVNVIVEMIAAERMKRKMPSTWVLYTDSLTAADVAKWLAAAATTEAAATANQVFGPVHVLPTGPQEQKDALTLLGVDLGLIKKQKDPGNGHISATTIDRVATAIQKNDSPKVAILLTYLPPLVRVHPALSKDVKQFHESRKDRGPNTVPVFIVIRSAG